MWTALTVVKTLEVGDHPEGIAADGSGSVYVALWGDDELVKIDAVKLEVVARTRVGWVRARSANSFADLEAHENLSLPAFPPARPRR